MVAIKDMEMPKGCLDCDFYEGTNTYCDGDILIPYDFFNDGKENRKHPNCPLVKIEPLTDSEQRIFLSAMSREERICKTLDSEKVDDSTVKKLVPIVNSIKRKVKKTLWD